MSRVGELVVPRRLGTRFRWLLSASTISNIGDGIAMAAGPLLVASQTHDPFLVSLGWILQVLPALLFGLHAGALADRLDRKSQVLVAGAIRVLVLLLLVGSIATDTVNITVTLVAMFLLGTAEVFLDTAYATLLPMMVPKADLGIANARIMFGFIVGNQLAGPAVGAAMFAAGMVIPFATQVACSVLALMLIAKIALPPPVRPDEPQHIRQDIADGVRWLWRHAAIRTLTLTIVTFNVTFGAAWSVLVLYSLERLDLGAAGFGLLTTVQAAGGLLSTAAYGWLERHVSLANIMRVGLVIETFTHLGLALTTTPWVAMTILFLFGAHAFVWGTTSTAVRQRAVPAELQGRVGSVYRIAVFGGIVVGGLIGGVLAQHWGVTAPFWFAFAGSAVILVLIWTQLSHIAHADEEARASSSAS